MSKYQNLAQHLGSIDGREWVATFAEIESALGFSLPRSAYTYQAWWANQEGGAHTQAAAWRDVGWRTKDLDLVGKRITFFRDEARGQSKAASSARSNPSAQLEPDAQPPEVGRKGLTIAEAKAGLANHFGVPASSIEITIKG